MAFASRLAARRALELEATALGKLDRTCRASGSGSSGRSTCGGGLDQGRGGGGGGAAGGGAVPDSRTREGEGLNASVDAEVGVRIGRLIGTGELDNRARGAATTTSNLDLHAGDKVFGLVDVGLVDACSEGSWSDSGRLRYGERALRTYQYARRAGDTRRWECSWE